MDKLPKKSLIKADREALAEILEKEAGDLVDEEIATLKARVSYLNSDERKRFASVLAAEKKVVADSKNTGEKPVEKMNHDQLMAKAIEVGFVETALVGKTNKELVEMIKNQQA